MHLLSLDLARPTARSLPPGAAAGMALAAAPAVLTVAMGGTNLSGAAVASSLVAGALMGFAIDDPAAAVFAASPTSLLVRRLHRVAVLLVMAAAVAGVVALLVALVHDGPAISLSQRAREGAAAAGLATAAATWLARRTGERRPGSFGLVLGLLGPLVVSALAWRVQGLPTLGTAQNGPRWWWVAAAAGAAAAWWSRDPARR